MPTLLEKGKIVSNDPSGQNKSTLDSWVAIDYILDWFRSRMDKDVTGPKDRVLVLKSDTGSGKSTVLPAYIYNTFLATDSTRQTIVITQPRVLTAIDITKGVSERYKIQLDERIGWVTGPNKRRAPRGILYVTIGVLSMQISTMTDTEFMAKYKFVVVDEVHEMSAELLLLLNKLKSMILRNSTSKNLPFVIVTSATFDFDKFLRYFDVYDSANHQPNFISVTGSTFEKFDHFEFEYGVKDYTKSAAELAVKIHNENLSDDPAKADILIFVTGKKPMTSIAMTLGQLAKSLDPSSPQFLVLTIDSKAVNKNSPDYQVAFIPADKIKRYGKSDDGNGKGSDKSHPIKYIRKIIISTNVAETGLTINTLKYVIDSGFHKGTEYYPVEDCIGLIERPANKSRVTQRRGRVGRVFPGHFYPLYPKYIYDALPIRAYSDVEIGDTVHIIMPLLIEQLKLGGYDPTMHELKGASSFSMDLYKPIMDVRQEIKIPIDIATLDTVDVISNDSLWTYCQKLYSLGFVKQLIPDQLSDNTKSEQVNIHSSIQSSMQMTNLGIAVSKITLPPEITRMILAGWYWGVNIQDLIAIAAYLSTDIRDFTIGREAMRQTVNWLEIYKQGLPNFLFHNVKDTVYWIYKVRLLIGDEFIEGCIMMNAIIKQLKYEKTEKIVTQIDTWCDLVNIPYSGILNMLRVRDEIAEQLITAGFDPYVEAVSLDDLEETAFMDYIVKLKYCIYDGFRLNYLRWNDKSQQYMTKTGKAVITPDMFTKNEVTIAEQEKIGLSYKSRAKILLYNKLGLKYNGKENLYQLSVDRVSVLDGYVYLD
jgi:HrpA-like RNA helicase